MGDSLVSSSDTLKVSHFLGSCQVGDYPLEALELFGLKVP